MARTHGLIALRWLHAALACICAACSPPPSGGLRKVEGAGLCDRALGPPGTRSARKALIDEAGNVVVEGRVEVAAAQPGCPTPVVAPAPPCGPAACGSGERDTCMRCTAQMRHDIDGGSPAAGPPSIHAEPLSEVCDGPDLGDATCASLGYAGGELACGPACTFDKRGCIPCTEDPSVVACRFLDVDAVQPLELVIAGRSGRVAAVWQSGLAEQGIGIHAAVFDRSLDKLSETACLGVVKPEDGRFPALAITSTRSGWLLAFETGSKRERALTLVALDDDGAVVGQSTRTGASNPRLARTSDGVILLSSVVARRGAMASIVDDLGKELRPATKHAFPYATIAPLRDGFLLIGDVAFRGELEAVHIGIDGSSTQRHRLDVRATQRVQVVEATGAQRTRLLVGAKPSLIELNDTGARVGAETPIDPVLATLTQSVPPVIRQRDQILFVVENNQQAWVRVSNDGLAASPPTIFTHDRGEITHPVAAVAVDGEEVLVGWLSRTFPGGIKLARIAPDRSGRPVRRK